MSSQVHRKECDPSVSLSFSTSWEIMRSGATSTIGPGDVRCVQLLTMPEMPFLSYNCWMLVEREISKRMTRRGSSLLFFPAFLVSDLIQMDWILILVATLNLLQYVVLFKVDIKHSVSHRYIVRKRKMILIGFSDNCGYSSLISHQD